MSRRPRTVVSTTMDDARTAMTTTTITNDRPGTNRRVKGVGILPPQHHPTHPHDYASTHPSGVGYVSGGLAPFASPRTAGNFLSPDATHGVTNLDRAHSLSRLHAQSSTETSGLGETVTSGFSSQESVHSYTAGDDIGKDGGGGGGGVILSGYDLNRKYTNSAVVTSGVSGSGSYSSIGGGVGSGLYSGGSSNSGKGVWGGGGGQDNRYHPQFQEDNSGRHRDAGLPPSQTKESHPVIVSRGSRRDHSSQSHSQQQQQQSGHRNQKYNPQHYLEEQKQQEQQQQNRIHYQQQRQQQQQEQLQQQHRHQYHEQHQQQQPQQKHHHPKRQQQYRYQDETSQYHHNPPSITTRENPRPSESASTRSSYNQPAPAPRSNSSDTVDIYSEGGQFPSDKDTRGGHNRSRPFIANVSSKERDSRGSTEDYNIWQSGDDQENKHRQKRHVSLGRQKTVQEFELVDCTRVGNDPTKAKLSPTERKKRLASSSGSYDTVICTSDWQKEDNVTRQNSNNQSERSFALVGKSRSKSREKDEVGSIDSACQYTSSKDSVFKPDTSRSSSRNTTRNSPTDVLNSSGRDRPSSSGTGRDPHKSTPSNSRTNSDECHESGSSKKSFETVKLRTNSQESPLNSDQEYQTKTQLSQNTTVASLKSPSVNRRANNNSRNYYDKGNGDHNNTKSRRCSDEGVASTVNSSERSHSQSKPSKQSSATISLQQQRRVRQNPGNGNTSHVPTSSKSSSSPPDTHYRNYDDHRRKTSDGQIRKPAIQQRKFSDEPQRQSSQEDRRASGNLQRAPSGEHRRASDERHRIASGQRSAFYEPHKDLGEQSRSDIDKQRRQRQVEGKEHSQRLVSSSSRDRDSVSTETASSHRKSALAQFRRARERTESDEGNGTSQDFRQSIDSNISQRRTSGRNSNTADKGYDEVRKGEPTPVTPDNYVKPNQYNRQHSRRESTCEDQDNSRRHSDLPERQSGHRSTRHNDERRSEPFIVSSDRHHVTRAEETHKTMDYDHLFTTSSRGVNGLGGGGGGGGVRGDGSVERGCGRRSAREDSASGNRSYPAALDGGYSSSTPARRMGGGQFGALHSNNINNNLNNNTITYTNGDIASAGSPPLGTTRLHGLSTNNPSTTPAAVSNNLNDTPTSNPKSPPYTTFQVPPSTPKFNRPIPTVQLTMTSDDPHGLPSDYPDDHPDGKGRRWSVSSSRRSSGKGSNFLGVSTDSAWTRWSRDRRASYRRRIERMERADSGVHQNDIGRVPTPVKKARQEGLKFVSPDLEGTYLSEDDLNELRIHKQQQVKVMRVIEKTRKNKFRMKSEVKLTADQWHILQDFWDHTLFVRTRLIGLLVSIITIIIMIVSITNHSWVNYESANHTVVEGLFDKCERSIANGTEECFYSDGRGFDGGLWDNCYQNLSDSQAVAFCPDKKPHWQNAVIGLMIFAAAFGFLASILSVCGVCTNPLPRKIYYFHSAGEIFFISALSTGVALVIFPIAIELDSSIHSHGFGIGYGLGWGGAFFFLAAAVCMSLDDLVRESSRAKCCRWCWRHKNNDRSDLRQV